MTAQNEPRRWDSGSIQTAIEELEPARCRWLLLNVLSEVITVNEGREVLQDSHKKYWEKRGWFEVEE